MGWTPPQLAMEANELIKDGELLHQTADAFRTVTDTVSGIQLAGPLTRDAGLGIGPLGPKDAFDSLIKVIGDDAWEVSQQLSTAADNLVLTAKKIAFTDDQAGLRMVNLSGHLREKR